MPSASAVPVDGDLVDFPPIEAARSGFWFIGLIARFETPSTESPDAKAVKPPGESSDDLGVVEPLVRGGERETIEASRTGG
jgi:hypothetical protein